MSTPTRSLALAFVIVGLAIASAADARPTPFFSSCDNQLAQCLRRSRIPEPCYAQYEECLRNSAYALRAPGTHAPGRRED